jgi:predicted RNA polymerase sigma factor
MTETAAEQVRETVDAVYQSESRRILATLIRLLGDFDLAEDALQDAFRAALEKWPSEGVPANPRAWLVSAGRFKAVDALRKRVGRIGDRFIAKRQQALFHGRLFNDLDELTVEQSDDVFRRTGRDEDANPTVSRYIRVTDFRHRRHLRQG